MSAMAPKKTLSYSRGILNSIQIQIEFNSIKFVANIT